MEGERPVIIAKDLVRRFGDFTAVNGVTFSVQRGEIFGFLGPNGSGKTTTIRMLLGLLRPNEGEAEVLGVPVSERPEAIRPRVGYMSQRFSLYNDLTVRQNLRFYARAYGLRGDTLQERIAESLRRSGLQGRERVITRELAGGWRQRLALGAAILHHPEVLFLDEPTAGVDPISRRAFWDLLYRLVGEGVTAFVTTHYMDEAEHCHRLAFIQRGELIAIGAPAEIKADKMPGKVLEIDAADAPAVIEALRGARERGRVSFQEIEPYGSLVHVTGKQVDETGKRRIERALREAGVQVRRIALIDPSLEDVFIASMH